MEYAIKVVKSALDKNNFTYEVPHWYRCFSLSQKRAVYKIGNAIRDDIAQQTTYRVRHLLNGIGLIPPLTSAQIRPILEMSRGDELAFIWFLMEMYYTSKKYIGDKHKWVQREWYNTNEQLLMSMIFYLDFYPTLRMLDRILPEGPSYGKKKETASQKQRNEEEQRNNKSQKRRQYKLPYFQNLVEPRPYGAPLNIKRPSRKANKIEIVPGAEPKANIRWFGNFLFNDPITHRDSIVTDQINKIVAGLSLDGIKSENMQYLTDTHRKIDAAEESLVNELKVIAQKKLLRYFDVNAKAREARQKRIVEQLEEASTFYRERFRALALKHRIQITRKELYVRNQTEPPADFLYLSGRSEKGSQCQSLSGKYSLDYTRMTGGAEKRRKSKKRKKKTIAIPETPEPVLPLETLPTPIKPPCTMGSENAKLPVYEYKSGIKHVPVISDSNCSICKDIDKTAFLKIYADPITAKCAYCGTCKIGTSSKKPIIDSKKKMSSNEEITKNFDGPKNQESMDKSRYFKMPNDNEANPCHFNFGQIFNEKTTRGREQFVKAEFIHAVDENIARLNQLLDNNYDQILADAAEENAAKVMLSEFNFFCREFDREERRSSSLIKRLDFSQKIFDPDDIGLMTDLLRIGLEKMEDNHNYVLPTLPNVWQVPMLLEWIRQRYGKKYSDEERMRLVKQSKNTMKSLIELLLHKTLPSPKIDYQISHTVPYSQRHCLMKEAFQFRKDYKHRLSHIIMETGRHFLMAMRPQLSNTSSIKSFYAYMPASLFDLNFSVNDNTKIGCKRKYKPRRDENLTEGV